jgi:hypothetical protein
MFLLNGANFGIGAANGTVEFHLSAISPTIIATGGAAPTFYSFGLDATGSLPAFVDSMYGNNELLPVGTVYTYQVKNSGGTVILGPFTAIVGPSAPYAGTLYPDVTVIPFITYISNQIGPVVVSGTAADGYMIHATSATTAIWDPRVKFKNNSGDSQYRMVIDGLPSINFGNGISATDTSVTRPSAGQLLIAGTSGGGLNITTTGDAQSRVQIFNDGTGVKFSDGTNAADLTLARSAAGVLTVTSVVNATTGIRINGGATSGHVLRGNGTNFVDAQLGFSDLSGSATSAQLPNPIASDEIDVTLITLDKTNKDVGLSRLSSGVLALGNGSAGSFAGTLKTTTVNAVTGFQQNGNATSGHVLRGNGTAFIDTQLAFSDLSGALLAAQNNLLQNAQTGTSYTIVDGDRGKLITLNNSSAVAVTLPQAGSGGGFGAGWVSRVENIGAGTATITPTTSTIDGAASITLAQYQGVWLWSDATNYLTLRTKPNVVPTTATTSNFLTSIAADGTATKAQPAFTDISGTASTSQIPNLDASKITTGQLALARGGTNADLSATGGASQVLKQVSSGAAITVGQLAFTDISGTASTGQIPNLDASKITTGQLALARGGTNADLSGVTANKVIKMNSGATALTSGMIWDNGSEVRIGSTTNIVQNASRLYIFGGANGCNIDVQGDGSTGSSDQAVVEVESSDYATTTGSILLKFGGPTALGTSSGFSNQNLAQLTSGGTNTTNLLIRTTGAIPIVFCTNDTETMRMLSGGGLSITETAAPSGSSSKDILYGDSTAHRLKMNNNNGGADTVVGAATTDTFTNKTFDTAGTGNSLKINGTAVTAVTGTGSVVLGSSPTITTPVLTGLPTGTGVASAATASTLASRDANANLTANNFLESYATTATAAGTTTLTVSSAGLQYFTGTTTQTVALPVASTLVLGQQWLIVNTSTGAVTVQSSGGNNVIILAGGTSALVTCILTSGTTAASWNAAYFGSIITSGKSLSVSNSLTLAGTDGTTLTFPSSSDTVAGIAVTQTLTNKRINPRLVTIADGTTVAINSDNADEAVQVNTQSVGTLTVSNPTGTPVDGQRLIFRIKSTNVQTFSFGTQFRGGTTTSLPTASTGSSKYDFFVFTWTNADSKWDILGAEFGH